MLATGPSGQEQSNTGNNTQLDDTRILIADEHAVVRSGLRKVLEAQPGWEVVAEAGDGKETISKATATKPNVMVLASICR
jgi:chemotaxis response regulator CheB